MKSYLFWLMACLLMVLPASPACPGCVPVVEWRFLTLSEYLEQLRPAVTQAFRGMKEAIQQLGKASVRAGDVLRVLTAHSQGHV